MLGYILFELIFRGAQQFVLFSLAVPGLVLWAPVWLFLYRKEAYLVRKSVEDNYDTVTEQKLILSFLYIILLELGAVFICGVWSALFLPVVGWLTLRVYEDGMAAARQFLTLLPLLKLWSTQKKEPALLLAARQKAKQAVDEMVQASSTEIPIASNRLKEPVPWAILSYFDVRRR